jgi:hypothetical protein
MYAVLCARTGVVVDATPDRTIAHAWAERYSGSGDLHLVLWRGEAIAGYRNGELVEVFGTGVEKA